MKLVNNSFSKGVMLNAYPDSSEAQLKDTMDRLHHPLLKDALACFISKGILLKWQMIFETSSINQS